MDQENITFTGQEQTDDFLLVGIGASAGGVQALKEFFQHVPANSGMAYVVILHLSPDHDSKLADVLQRVTTMPVLKVLEDTKIQQNHIYVVPPNQHLVITDGHIAPSLNVKMEDRRAPVDIFFRNLADTYGPRAICVVLSGTGANGSMGLKRIKEKGGVAYVQSPIEAEFNEMPRYSIATELVDEVLPVAQIPQRIVSYRNHVGSVQIVPEPEQRPEHQQSALREIFTQLRLRTGNDFSNYKRPTLLRRIERRINLRSLPDLSSYIHYLQENPEETNALLKDLLISVTNFFRDQKAFETLEREVIPVMFDGKRTGDTIRIWVAGCATGEEAYSIAMLCAERAMRLNDAPRIQLFATDIDEAAVSIAREGYYTQNDAADVSPDRLRRFFNKEGDGYRIRREIRETIIFAQHNFLKDPPFSRLDLISCRNVMIYLNATAQERVSETFHFALRPKGFLFLGTSETVDGAADLFSNFNRESHIYQATEVTVRNYPIPESVPHFRFAKYDNLQKPEESENRHNRISFGELHQKLLEQYAPPSIVINEEYEIVHMSEKAGKYLEFAGGEPSQNLLKLIRPEIRLELRSALYQAVQNKTIVEARRVSIANNGQTQFLDFQIRPVMRDGESGTGFILVVFKPSEPGEKEGEPIVVTSDAPIAKQLEEELIVLKSQLRSSAEQHEFQAEELKASNEELQAMNEELRSAAEELETSKEELQSINEELRTVNQELKVQIEETSLTSNNFQNLINSADVGTIFLDRSLSIRLFTPAVLDIFNLKNADYGRPITDITNRLQYDELVTDAETVLEKLTPLEREVTTSDNHFYLMRLLPYRTKEDRINGVVITFFDITSRKESENALQKSEIYLRLIIESAKDYDIFTLDKERQVVQWSSGASSVFGYSEAEITGQPVDILFTPEDRKIDAPRKEAEKAESTGRSENERWHVRKDGARFWGSGSVSSLRDPSGKLIGFVKILRNLTEQKRVEEALARVAEFSAFRIELNDLLRVAEKPDEIVSTATNLLGERLHLDRVFLFDIPSNGESIIIPARHYTGDKVNEKASKSTLEKFAEISSKKLLAADTIIISDAQNNGEESKADRKVYEEMDVQALVAHRFFRAGKPVAGLMVTRSSSHEWPDDEIAIIRDTAERTWVALERAKAEEELRQTKEQQQIIIESAKGFAIFSTTADGIVNSWNTGAAEIFGWREEEIIGQSVEVMFTPEDRATGQHILEMETAVQKGIAPDIRWHIRKNESLVYINGFVHPVYDAARNLTGFVKIGRDMTAQHNAEIALRESEENYRAALEKEVELRTTELKDMNTSLRYANENLQQFASIASHDLQEPLRKIKLFSSVLKNNWSEKVPPEAKEIIQKIRMASDRMSQLIQEVLEYSRIAYGAKQFIPTNLHEIIQNVLSDLELLLEETEAKVTYPQPLPVIDAIPLQMHQIFHNILTNALKFRRKETPPEINIRFSELSGEEREQMPDLGAGEYWHIVISDNGIGFDPEFSEQIFQLFERLHSSEEFEGTGVGLALCKKIVENHQGNIYATSKDGEGAAFHVVLPFKREVINLKI